MMEFPSPLRDCRNIVMRRRHIKQAFGMSYALQLAPLATVLCVTAHVGADGTIPPSGQMSLTDPADLSIFLLDDKLEDGRHGVTVDAHHIGADPSDPTRLTMLATEVGDAIFGFPHGAHASSLVVEWEQSIQLGEGSGATFFGLTDSEFQRLTLQRNSESTVVDDVPGVGDIEWLETIPMAQWVRLRLRFDARSGKAGSNDGTLKLGMDTGAGLVTMIDIANHDLTTIKHMNFLFSGAVVEGDEVAWRKLVWDARGPDWAGAGGNTESLWRDRDHQLGVMEPDGDGGVRMTVMAHYDAGLHGLAETDYGAVVEVDTDGLFSAPISQTIAIDPADAFNGVATLEGLAPNIRYYVRAQLLRDGEVIATTTPTSVITISVPGGEPGKIHLIHGSCSNTVALQTPHTVFGTALAAAPTDSTLVFSHVGDLNYIDVQLNVVNEAPGENNPNATTEFYDRIYNQSMLSDPWRELAANATCWFMWDDHDVVNGWAAPGPGSPNAVHPELLEIAQESAHHWWSNRLLDETSLTRHYYHIETAQCLFIYLDTRSYRTDDTMIGSEQTEWLKLLLSTKVRPLTFLMSTVSWSSSDSPGRENWASHTLERDELIEHFLSANGRGYMFLMSGDRHFIMHNTSSFQQWQPRIQGEWMNGAFNTSRQPLDGLGWLPGENFEADHIETFGVPANQTIRGYLKVDIDEADLSVRIAITNGITGEDTYQVTAQVPSTDLDGDGVVGASDLLLMLGEWGPCADCQDCLADLDSDCIVGSRDLLILLGNWD